MKKSILLIVITTGSILLSGCFGGTSRIEFSPALPSQTSQDKNAKVVANVTAFNRGIYLFNLFPIWSGAPDMPNMRRYNMFRNRVREGYNVMMMENALSSKNADDLENIQSTYHSTGMYSLWILWNRSMRTTAVAIKRNANKESKK